MKVDIKPAVNRVKVLFREQVIERIERIIAVSRSNPKERRRILILLLSSIFILDYLVYCLHVEKNIFNIFPSIPALEKSKTITIYLPGLDGSTIFTEDRSVPYFNNDQRLARHLFNLVVRGSNYKNTARTVPIKPFVRRVWIYGGQGGAGKICAFDVEPELISGNFEIIKNSEALFRKALEKTITENMSSITKVLLLEKGVPGARMWEVNI